MLLSEEVSRTLQIVAFTKEAELEKPRDFDPFGHAGFAHLWLQYD